MVYHGIDFDPPALGASCRKHQIARFSSFGSILGADFRPGSDVDLRIPQDLSQYFRQKVLHEAKMLYAA